jgi:hypothetical protein
MVAPLVVVTVKKKVGPITIPIVVTYAEALKNGWTITG